MTIAVIVSLQLKRLKTKLPLEEYKRESIWPYLLIVKNPG